MQNKKTDFLHSWIFSSHALGMFKIIQVSEKKNLGICVSRQK